MYNIGIIGSGLQADRRAQAIMETQIGNLRKIASIDKDSLNKLGNKYNVATTSSWKEVVIDNEINVIIICTPPHLHFEIASCALENGKHVLCEKPLTKELEDAKAIKRISLDCGKKIMCGFNHRHHPAMLKAHEILTSGVIGRPITGRAVYGICGREECENEWRSNTKFVSGGQLMEQGIHAIDLFRWYMGEFDSLSSQVSTQVFPIEPLEDTAVVLLHGENGKTATLHSSITQWINKFRFELYCTKGYFEITGLGGSYDSEKLKIGFRRPNDPFQETITEYSGRDKSWINEWVYFINNIENKADFEMGNVDDAIQNMYIVEKAYLSSNEQRRIQLDKIFMKEK